MNCTKKGLSEFSAIDSVIQHYLDGAISGSGKKMSQAFHRDATIFGYIGEDLFAGPSE